MDLFHICTLEAWKGAQAAGAYRPPSLAKEGFIHFSAEHQWLGAANRFFRSYQEPLVLLCLRTDRLAAPLQWEPADGDVFPHLYGELNLDAVFQVLPLNVAEDGSIQAPGF